MPSGSTIRLPRADVASTAVAATTPSSCLASCVAASASPKRASASRTRPRSASSSARRASSCAAMSLSAAPSSANSSRPRTGTRSWRWPCAIPRAAVANRRRFRTIARPCRYATTPTSARHTSSPARSRSRVRVVAASITAFRVRTASRAAGTRGSAGAANAR